jgi:SAM-dependent methyltransferase
MSEPAIIDGTEWQRSWDRQQQTYMPDREQRFATMLDVVQAMALRDDPAILDLAGGTGSISLRALRRLPRATTTLVDIDPVLLTIARASLDERTDIVPADLRDDTWTALLPRRDYDAVLTATALHWIDGERLRTLYREVHSVIRPGGVFINADHMTDPGLLNLSQRVEDWEREHREAKYAADPALSWEGWWERLARDPALGPLIEQRRLVFNSWHGDDFTPTHDWHIDALRAAGFTEVGLIWRGLSDAAVVAVR